MTGTTLQQIYEEDRQSVLEALQHDRLPASAQGVMEKEMDRVMYRYLDRCDDPNLSEAAQHMIAIIKLSLPLMESVNDVRVWARDLPEAKERGSKLKRSALAFLIAGALLVVASFLAAVMQGVGIRLGALIGLFCTLAGGACLFQAGRLANGNTEKKQEDQALTRREYLIDPERVWGDVRNALLVTDEILNKIREAGEIRLAEKATRRVDASTAEIETFTAILESAYALMDQEGAEDAREIIANIRFYLHSAGYELQDYNGANRQAFELLPGSGQRTIRPAVMREGKTVKKGAATM